MKATLQFFLKVEKKTSEGKQKMHIVSLWQQHTFNAQQVHLPSTESQKKRQLGKREKRNYPHSHLMLLDSKTFLENDAGETMDLNRISKQNLEKSHSFEKVDQTDSQLYEFNCP